MRVFSTHEQRGKAWYFMPTGRQTPSPFGNNGGYLRRCITKAPRVVHLCCNCILCVGAIQYGTPGYWMSALKPWFCHKKVVRKNDRYYFSSTGTVLTGIAQCSGMQLADIENLFTVKFGYRTYRYGTSTGTVLLVRYLCAIYFAYLSFFTVRHPTCLS